MKTFCIVPAAGVGKRMGGEIPKQFLPLNNKPVILHTLLALESSSLINEIYIVAGENFESFLSRETLIKSGVSKLRGIVSGGKERQDSVYNGLVAIPAAEDDMVLIHDGVRPFVTNRIIADCIKEATRKGGAIAAIPISDTIKMVANGEIGEGIDRSLYLRLQTPQCFVYKTLRNAHQQARKNNVLFTDDSSAIKAAGGTVGVVQGDESNIKITTQSDLILASCMANSPSYTDYRGK